MTDNFIRNFIAENDQFKNVINPETNHNLLFKINTNNSFETLIKSIFLYLKQPQKIPQGLVEIKFKELLFNIALNFENKSLLDFLNSVNQNKKITIENIMIENFQHSLKIEDFAKLCGRSLSAFKRDFNTDFKTTPSRWLMKKRLEYAKTLLTGTELNVNQICNESGFKNVSHFIRAFKNKYNTTPNQFRLAFPKG